MQGDFALEGISEMGWFNSLSLKPEEPRLREGQGLVQNQDQGRTKLWPDTVRFAVPSSLPPLGPQS